MKFEEAKVILEKLHAKEEINSEELAEIAWREKDDPELRAIINDLDKYFKTPMEREGYESVSYLFGYSVATRVKRIFYYEDFDDSPAKSYRNNGNWFIIVNPALKHGDKKELRAILLHEMAHVCCEGNYGKVRNKKTGEIIDNHDGHRGIFDTVLKAIKRVYGEKVIIAPPDQFISEKKMKEDGTYKNDHDGIHVDGNNEVSRKFPKWGSRMGRMEFHQRQVDKGKVKTPEATNNYRYDLVHKKYSSVK